MPVLEGHEWDTGVNDGSGRVCRGGVRHAIVPAWDEVEHDHSEGEKPKHHGGGTGP